MTQKYVDGVLVDCTPEEEMEIAKRNSTPRVGTDKLDMGPSIAEQLGEHINVKS
jgi:hypothetical protein